MQGQRLADDRVGEAHLELLGVGLDLWLVGQIVAEKDHTGIAGSLVGGLAEAVGTHLAVEQIDLQVRA